MKLRHYLDQELAHLRNDSVLRLYGFLLTFTHVLTMLFWQSIDMARSLSAETVPICWPGLDFCPAWHGLQASEVATIITSYGISALLVCGLWLTKRTAPGALLGLVAVTILQAAIMAIDLRTTMNAHTVTFWMIGGFVLLPKSRLSILTMFVAIYVAAGLTKLNPFWLSGENLGRLPEAWAMVPLALFTYGAIVLELIICPMLLAKRFYLREFAASCLLLFHGASVMIIGWYFPLVMITMLLSVVAMTFFRDAKLSPAPISFFRTLPFLGFFVALQIVPKALSHEPDLTGEGKFFAFYMFDAKVRCEIKINLKLPDGSSEERDFSADFRTLSPRLACNPLTMYWRAKDLCAKGRIEDRTFRNFDLTATIRRLSDSDFRPLVAISDFCTAQVTYHALSHNTWIQDGNEHGKRNGPVQGDAMPLRKID